LLSCLLLQWLYGVRVEQGVLSKLVARKLPRLAAHLAALRLDAGSFAAPWVAGLYVSALPPTTLVRVWDCAMSEGSKVLLRTGLVMMIMMMMMMMMGSAAA
jgi:TBC1 domain family member 2A